MASITQPFTWMHSSIHIGLVIQTFTHMFTQQSTTPQFGCITIDQQKKVKMANRFELLNNLQRAMQPLAHWYDIIDTHVMLEIQSEVMYKVLHNRQCNIKWAPIHKQVAMMRKLLSHIFEHYTEVQDDGYISDEDIDKYPEMFVP